MRILNLLALAAIVLFTSCSAVQCRNQHAHTADVPPRCFTQRVCADGSRHFVEFEPCP